jgi:DNA gyrase subunit A
MSIVDFPVQGRGGQGVSALKPTDKTGLVAGIALVDADGSLAIYSGKGRRLRLAVKDLPASGRSSNKCANLAKYGDSKVLFDGEEVAWVAAD